MTTLLIAILFVLVLDLIATCLTAYGMAKLREDFEFWQNLTRALLSKYWADTGKKPFIDWLAKNPDRPNKDDPPFAGPPSP